MPKTSSNASSKHVEDAKTAIDSIFEEQVDAKVKPAEDAQALQKGTYYSKFVPQIQKRDGAIVPFDFHKIVRAIGLAMEQTGEGSPEEAEMVGHKVVADVVRIAKKYKNFLPTVEGLQDEVERQLILSEYVKTAKHYIIYREERARVRKNTVVVPERVRKLAEESSKYFEGNPMGEFVYLRTYARWIEAESRRETWIETVDRYVGFMRENLGEKLTDEEYTEVREAILKQEAMPSMRLMQFAGAPARRCNAVAYNCSFIAPMSIEDFGEVLYLSASGCGVGFSAESKNIEQLPQIKAQTGTVLKTHVVEDSKEGWAEALVHGMQAWYSGKDVQFDYEKIRPAGARLRTMGGKASGPEPLRSLLDFARAKILSRQNRRLRNIDAHDILCKIGEAIVSGGVRRSAMISLSDLDDDDIRHAKDGAFYNTEPQRMLANNSAVYEVKPTSEEFMEEWMALMKGRSGERGIFNRGGLMVQTPKRRLDLWEKQGIVEHGHIVKPVGTNPCGEIILQSKQFCNLSEVIARRTDTLETLKKKARIATILGTYQSSLTRFNYLSKDWTDNCQSERLLGVSVSGQWDSPEARKPEVLRAIRDEAVATNKKYAKRFGIPASSAVTAVKPSGTVSQTVNCASGMHPRHSEYYIRRIRISATDSLFKMLKDQGIPHNPEVGQTEENANTYVLEFPVKSPKSSVYNDDLSAIEQLEYWKVVKENYTEHNPSVTISIGDNEWVAVAHWLYEHWEIIGGLSFLPRQNHSYRLAPYEAIDKETYEKLAKKFENIDYSKIVAYELRDETEQARELACAGGVCEIN
ncbi:MAG: ribonucleoside-triphosphate reductase [Candidatus Pacebacteria bacterium]|nr:ribonucleoside-triphosphate reductase [Candidatus Paceibacterota bacterium]